METSYRPSRSERSLNLSDSLHEQSPRPRGRHHDEPRCAAQLFSKEICDMAGGDGPTTEVGTRSLPLTILHASSLENGAALRGILTSLGHKTLQVRTLAEAKQVLASSSVDLAIVDSTFEEQLGAQVTEELRAVSPLRNCLPVMLVCPPGASNRLLELATRYHADDALSPPLSPDLVGLRLRSLRRMSDTEHSKRTLMNRVSEAILIVDEHGLIRSANSSSRNLFGYSDGELIGRHVRVLVPIAGEDAPEQSRGEPNFAHGFTVCDSDVEVKARRKTGQTFPATLSITRLRDSGGAALLFVMRDKSLEVEREKYAHLALHDNLTGLPNRVQLLDAIEQEATLLGVGKPGFSLLFVDVDDFKQINDLHGHATGDAVLTTVAARLRHATGRQDMVARLAGDEFVVMLRNVGNRRLAERVADRLKKAVGSEIRVSGGVLSVHISIGVAVAGEDGVDAMSLLEAADQAMYCGKRLRKAAQPPLHQMKGLLVQRRPAIAASPS